MSHLGPWFSPPSQFEAYADTLLEMEPQFNGGKRITREFYNTRMSGRQNPVLLVR